MGVFAVGAERIAMIQDAGFEARPVPEVTGAVFRADRGFRWLAPEHFRRNLAAEKTVLAEIEPDVVVFDFRFTTSLSAHLSGRPSVSILHGNALRLALRPRETALLLIGDGQKGETQSLRLRVMRRLFPAIFQLIMRAVARRLTPILKMHGRSPANSPFELLLGDEILVADLPELLPPELPPHSHVVGPLMWSGWEQPAPWLDELADRPLIYVTMGSTVEARAALTKIVDALRDAPYNVVISTGSLSLPADVQLPAHIRAFQTVPGAAVTRRSVAVVHHGGHETLMQALAAGVPSLILPANPDQVLIAQQAQALGIGHSMWRPGDLPAGLGYLRKVTPAEIRRAVEGLIADRNCVQVCQAFKRRFESLRGAAAAAEVVEGIAAHQPGWVDGNGRTK
jgi:UDP:flavonoid glycosyltransferase YjiC (YdhE family)